MGLNVLMVVIQCVCILFVENINHVFSRLFNTFLYVASSVAIK